MSGPARQPSPWSPDPSAVDGRASLTILPACPLCGGRSLRPLPLPVRWIGREVFAPLAPRLGLRGCAGCGLVMVNPRPGPGPLRAFYDGDAYVCHQPGDSPGQAAKARHLLGLLERFLAPGAERRLLDYGCGGGFLLREASGRGWRATGFDIGQAALRACREQGLNVTGDLDSLRPGSFDALVLNHVIEHVEDPPALLRRLAPLLAPGGRLLLEAPNVNSLRARLSAWPGLSRRLGLDERHRAFPIHLWYFSPRTLPRLARDLGWTVEGCFTAGLGLEELRFRPEEGDSRPASPPARRPAAGPAGGAPPLSPALRLKEMFKKVYFGAGCGENVLVVASPPA